MNSIRQTPDPKGDEKSESIRHRYSFGTTKPKYIDEPENYISDTGAAYAATATTPHDEMAVNNGGDYTTGSTIQRDDRLRAELAQLHDRLLVSEQSPLLVSGGRLHEQALELETELDIVRRELSLSENTTRAAHEQFAQASQAHERALRDQLRSNYRHRSTSARVDVQARDIDGLRSR